MGSPLEGFPLTPLTVRAWNEFSKLEGAQDQSLSVTKDFCLRVYPLLNRTAGEFVEKGGMFAQSMGELARGI